MLCRMKVPGIFTLAGVVIIVWNESSLHPCFPSSIPRLILCCRSTFQASFPEIARTTHLAQRACTCIRVLMIPRTPWSRGVQHNSQFT
uniref:Secreted protein n=1 Tax=Picea glauca TaxID=3330 RepID=A0A101LXL3_PICGL|nr:hypothetical protein ABT39_MTgene6213 [Picea glauca]QHR88735.1 hypothetical protein Q903MT_gene2749 [Picea sitchensis]